MFGNIDPEGSRLTELAERAHMTKQSVGEVTSDLEQRGYLERVPDPGEGGQRSSVSPSEAATHRHSAAA